MTPRRHSPGDRAGAGLAPPARPGPRAAGMFVLLLLLLFTAIPAGSQFKVSTELVLVDVTVLDRQGNPVRGLKTEQFQVFEDGQPQKIRFFEFQDIAARQAEPQESPEAPREMIRIAASVPATIAAAPPSAAQSKDRRLIFLFFDSASLPPEDFVRVRESAEEFIHKRMTPADLVAVALMGNSVRIVEHFTNDREALIKALARVAPGEAGALAAEGPTAPGEEEQDEANAAFTPDETELNIFNSDRKLGAIEVVSRTLRDIPGKKMMVYYSGGVSTTGMDNQSALRAAVDAANRANVSIYTVDAGGLAATVPGGDARQEFTRGTSLFSGNAMRRQRDRHLNQQDSIYALAQDTGGKALLDSNDLGEVFQQIQRDTTGYYLLGYYTQNAAADGRFRRIKVTVNSAGSRVRHRPGYFAPKEYRLYTREEREQQLREAIAADMPFLDLRLAAEVDYFLHSDKEVLASVSVKLPASQLELPEPSEKQQVEFDVLGQVRTDEGQPAAVLRDTVRLPWEGDTVARVKAGGVQYGGGFRLRPGWYAMKLLVRENRTGKIGTFEQVLNVPNLAGSPVALSSVVLGTVVRDDRVVPSITRVFRTDQELLVYLHAYRPAIASQNGQPMVSAGLLFFQGGRQASQTPLEHVSQFADRTRRAAHFRLRVPLKAFALGRYWLQVNVLDHVGGHASFARVPFAVLPPLPRPPS